MSSGQYRRELAQIAKDIGKIRTDIGREEEKARKARGTAAQKRSSALRASSQASRDSYNRQAATEDRKVEVAERNIGALHDKLSSLLTKQHSRQQSLATAERSEQAAKDRADDSKRRKEKAAQDASDRAAVRRRQIEKNHAREIGRLSSSTIRHVHVREPEPEMLRVLYLTASPATADIPGLRVDAEVNGVLKALRGAKHRDLIDLRHRPAATIEDLIDGLNDHRPHVVHFSGHANGGLLFDNAHPIEPGDHLVSYDAVASILAATGQPPTLVVLNACRTSDGVARMLEAAAVVVATNDAVGDASAAIFATHFYGAIAAAQTIGDAVDQARAMVALALADEPDVITVSAAEGVDPETLQLVRPSGT